MHRDHIIECPFEATVRQEKEARAFGFYWSSLSQLIKQIQSECLEVEEAYHKGDRVHLEEEIGDLLQAAACLAIYCGLDPKETLHKSVDKFQKRYECVVDLAKKDGFETLLGESEQVLMEYWSRAKLPKL